MLLVVYIIAAASSKTVTDKLQRVLNSAARVVNHEYAEVWQKPQLSQLGQLSNSS